MKYHVYFLILVSGLLAGCFTSPAGLDREQAIYRNGTNVVAFVSRDLAPALPAPWNGVASGAAAVAVAVLGAWNAWQQRQISSLKAQKDPIAPKRANGSEKNASG